MTRRGTLLFGWTLALLGIALFTWLGFWQSDRAVEKQAMLDAAAQALEPQDPKPLALAVDASRSQAYDWAAGRGEFADTGPLWLDNQQRNGRSGVHAYRIFNPDQGVPLLVDLGWLPLPGDRRLPAIARPSGPMKIRGLLTTPPSPGIAIGEGLVAQDGGWLLTRVDMGRIAAQVGLERPLAPRVLRLDPTLPLGYERDLELLANTLPPDRHRGYALQWFGLALTVLIVALVMTFRKGSR